jgi:hypothetical protein
MAALNQPLGRHPPAGAARRIHATLHRGSATLPLPPAAGWLRSISRLAGIRRLVLRGCSTKNIASCDFFLETSGF